MVPLRLSLLQDVVHPFIERTAQLRLDILSKLFGVFDRQMRFERLPALPELHDGKVVGPVHVAQDFQADRAWVFPGVCGVLL